MTDWHTRAACVGENPELFFPGSGNPQGYLHAKRICSQCPVKTKCLTECMETEADEMLLRHGMYGGLTPKERHALARGKTA